MSTAVELRNVGVRFDLDRQLRPVTPALAHLRRKCTHEWALRNLDLTLSGGDGVALVGSNGAGKTTLLRTIAGVVAPDEGTVSISGRIGSLLSIDAGLMPMLTGRENSVLVGTLLGLSRARAQGAVPAIETVSGLGSAFDRPVITYSQGMKARLGFAVIEQADPNILLLDEVHEAIDESFRSELERRVQRIRERGGIVVAAGHDHAMLSRLCDQTITLDAEGLHDVSRTRAVAASRI